MLLSSIRKAAVAAVLSAAGLLVAAATSASAATVSIVGGTAVYSAAPGERNDVRAGELTGAGPDLTVVDAGAALTAGAGCEQVDAHTARCADIDPGTPRPLAVSTGNGDDRVNVDDDRRVVTIDGGPGDDTLHGGMSSGGSVEVAGGPGRDDVSAAMNYGGGAVVRGDAGDDVLSVGEAAGDHVYGGAGDDRLSVRGCDSTASLDGGRGDDAYSFGGSFEACGLPLITGIVPGRGLDTLDQSAVTQPWAALTFTMADCAGCVERVVGTPFGDTITGDDRPQAIAGGDGADVLVGGGGSDLLDGGGGDDAIDARDGRVDVVACGDGNDSVMADRRDVVRRDCEGVERTG